MNKIEKKLKNGSELNDLLFTVNQAMNYLGKKDQFPSTTGKKSSTLWVLLALLSGNRWKITLTPECSKVGLIFIQHENREIESQM